MQNEPFIDYYQLMQISPNAEAETIQRVFRMLSNRYHPENRATGDPDRFNRLARAYEILSKRETRAAYDLAYQLRNGQPLRVFEMKEFAAGIEGEGNRRMGILCLLYNRRRSNPEMAGLSILDLEGLMGFPREHLMFSLWYLKEAELVRQDETTDYAITGSGVDYLEKSLPSNQVLYQLMKASEMGDFDRSETELTAHNTA
jgi:curved DNA-binding protein CbpA